MRTHRPVCRDVEQAHGLPSRTSTDESRRSNGNRKLRSSARRSDLALPFVAPALRQGPHRSPGALGVEMADETMLTRRNFVRLTGASTLSLFFTDRLGVTRQLFAQIPDTLDPATVAKFATPMLIPPVMPRAGRITLAGGKNADYYEISMKQFTQQILPEGLPSDDRLGIRCGGVREPARPPGAQRALADDRSEVEQAGSREVDQRFAGSWRRLPPPPAAGRSDAPLGQPTGRRVRPRQPADVRRRRPDRTPARYRS